METVDLITILDKFGNMGLWGIVIYKILGIISQITFLLLIGYGIKKAWRPASEYFKEL